MGPRASTAKLDELVKKMNSATGAAKTEAWAELLTALVQDRRSCEAVMANMMEDDGDDARNERQHADAAAGQIAIARRSGE